MAAPTGIVGRKRTSTGMMILIYAVCIFLALLSILPFLIMIVNSTRSTVEIQAHAISLIPSKYLFNNIDILTSKDMFIPWRGFLNSAIISTGVTVLGLYFSTLTAFAVVAYQWKLRNAFYGFIIAVMMLPSQLSGIGFIQFMYQIHMTNSLLPLIIPSIAAPATVFFMRQFMVSSLPMEILQSARVDGAGEFRTFNQIVLPIMKPALATQAIFSFVGSWNQLFMPQVLLTEKTKYTMPIMISLLRGDIYKVEFGAIYAGCLLTALPLIVVYLILSKYIIAGVALGGVKG